MVFCYQNCSDLLWEKIVLVIEKNFWNSKLQAENVQNFEIIRTFYSSSERSEQSLKQNVFNLFLEASQIWYMYCSKFEKVGHKNHIMFVAFNVHAHFYCAVVSDRDHFLRNNWVIESATTKIILLNLRFACKTNWKMI